MASETNGWRTDFDAPDIQDHPIIVYATDDDGYAYGIAGWRHSKGKVTLCWGMDGNYREINNGIERALCWKRIDYPGLEFLDRLAEGLRNPPIPHQENT